MEYSLDLYCVLKTYLKLEESTMYIVKSIFTKKGEGNKKTW